MNKMNRKTVKYGILAGLIFVLVACAQINPLQGGSKDQYAPRIDSSGTYPLSGQTNFNGDEIIIKFEEYIALNNPNDNIIITPQLENQPVIEAKNKKLSILFNEQLKENTTYTISFNRAVTDITEKNDSIFQFVFSTGDYIDSLQITGRVTDAFTNTPEEGLLVGLYEGNVESEFDSIPFNERPVYIAQTNKSGKFVMNYLKGGEYYLFAIQDDNRNLRLDPSEKMAFIGEKIEVSNDNEPFELFSFMSENSASKLTTTKFDYPGRLEFIFSNPPEKFELKHLKEGQPEIIKEDSDSEDSLVYWLTGSPGSKMKFIVDYGEEPDTLNPLYKGSPGPGEITGLTVSNNLVNGKLLPKTNLGFEFSEPIESFAPEKIHFMTKDSVELTAPLLKTENLRTLVADSLPENIGLIKIDSAAVTSFFGHINREDIWVSLSVLETSYFGSLILNVDTVFQVPVFVELLDEKNEVIRSVSFQKQMFFPELIPGKYQLRLIFDTNSDGEWTPGDLKEKRQPESVIYNRELIDIKSKWEKEVDWIIEN